MSHNKTFARFIISKTKRGVDDERKWFSSVKLTTGLLLNFQLRPTTRQSWSYSLWKSVETIFRTAMMEGEEIYSNFHSYTLRCTIHPFSPASLSDVLFLLSSLLVHSLLPRVSCFFNLLFLSPLFLFFLFLFFFFLFIPLLRYTVRKYTVWNTKDLFTYVEREKGRTCYGKVVEKSQLPEIRTTIKEIKIVCLAWSTTGLPWDSAVFFFTFFFGYVPSGQPMDRSVFYT